MLFRVVYSIEARKMNIVREWNLEGMLPSHIPFGELSRTIQKHAVAQRTFSLKSTNAVNYLSSVESYISKQLISSQNYAEIKTLASQLTGNITSFFGFETRLNSRDARSDYLFAVSKKKGEREALVNLLQNGTLPKIFSQKQEWQRIREFAKEWADPSSVLYNNICGLWFEFDIADSSSEIPVPGIFMQTKPLRIDTPEDIEKCTWITRIAMPLLIGQPISETLERRFLNCIEQLPEGASLFHVAVMLSRASSAIRLVINRMRPDQIVPYLKSIGWSDNENEGLSKLLEELQDHTTRINLHVSIGDNIDPKIGLECNFSPDQYNMETKWSKFFDYLIEKGLCLPEKKSALLGFPGVEQEDISHNFNLESYITAVKISHNDFSKALVRYINHVKISYAPNHSLEAKAYPGVRLFGCPNESTTSVQSIM